MVAFCSFFFLSVQKKLTYIVQKCDDLQSWSQLCLHICYIFLPNNKTSLLQVNFFSEALLFAKHGENMLCTEIVLNVKKQFLYTACSLHVLNLDFSCTYWTCNSMNNQLSLWVSWCKNKSFWQRFTCTDLQVIRFQYYNTGGAVFNDRWILAFIYATYMALNVLDSSTISKNWEI